jgi:RNA polymerase sigma-70 factor (ECF subfamily)
MATLPLTAGAETDLAGSHLSADETALLVRARAGDQRALRDFYGRYQQQVRGHLFRLLGRDPDLDDVVQTVFSRAFGALDGFRGNSALSTWLYRITANTTHNLLRQRFRRDRVRRAFARLKLSGDTEAGDALEARNEVEGVLHRLHPDLS